MRGKPTPFQVLQPDFAYVDLMFRENEAQTGVQFETRQCGWC
jgi:hypothetical protein